MKKVLWLIALCVCAALGGAYLFSLFLWTDPVSGFATAGSTGLRYFAMLLPVLLAWTAGRTVSEKQRFPAAVCAPWLTAVAAASVVYGVVLILSVFSGAQIPSSSHHMTIGLALLGDLAELLLAVLFLLFGLWAVLLRWNKSFGDGMLYLGVLGSAAFFLHTVLCFLVRPASVYRIPPAVEILAALAALLFVTAYLRAHYMPWRQGSVRAVCRNGLLAFFFCTCLALPQAVWQAVSGVGSIQDVLLAILLGLTGIWGAAVSAKMIWSN